jgi:Fe-S-cluster containining protein
MSFSEYLNYENVAQAMDQALASATEISCQRGRGKCCDRQVPTTKEDRLRIIKAFKNGDLEDSIRTRALERLKDKNDKRCPFLDEQNECSIYNERPLICRSFGVAGEVRPGREHKLIMALNMADSVRSEQYLGASDTVCMACEECQPRIPRRFRASVVEAVTRVSAFIARSRQNKQAVYLHKFMERDLTGTL